MSLRRQAETATGSDAGTAGDAGTIGDAGTAGGAGDSRSPSLWFGLLGGAAAWAVQFLVGYLASEGACVGAGMSGAVTSGAVTSGAVTSGAVVGVAVLSVVAFAVSVAAALAGRRVWLRERDELRGGSGFMGQAGMLLSAVFAFLIAVQALPLLLGGGCA